MQEKLNDLKKYAQDKSKKIIAKIRDKKDDEDMNIESYDGDDAYYTGSDEDYEEFLRSVEGGEPEEDAIPVENTQRINLGDTINLQGMIDKFREKAGELSNAAKKFKDDISTQIEDFKTANVNKADEDEQEPEEIETAEEIFEEEITAEPVISRVVETPPSRALDIDGFREGMTAVAEGLSAVDKKLDSVEARIGELSDRLQSLELQSISGEQETSRGIADLQQIAGGIGESISEVKQETAGISKLSDSVFDLKNTQINTKNTISELEMSFIKLKKKCILGVAALSVLGAIAIVLQIIQLLS